MVASHAAVGVRTHLPYFSWYGEVLAYKAKGVVHRYKPSDETLEQGQNRSRLLPLFRICNCPICLARHGTDIKSILLSLSLYLHVYHICKR